ncbi:hypothetical protein Chelonae_p0137 [[Mycobacterium] chelonae subsp. bovistauri]|nr:hypothetical protein Chelonae_p0137 [Mycobacterium sp. QIA-37]
MENVVGRHNRPAVADDVPIRTDWSADFLVDSEVTAVSPAVIDSDSAFSPTPPPWFRG